MGRKKPQRGERDTAPDDGAGDEDPALFRRLMADARPLRFDGVPPPRRRPAPRAAFSRRDREAVMQERLDPDPETLEAAGDGPLRFARPSVGRNVLRRLARGSISRQAEIDLHGLTRHEAKAELSAFIEACAGRGLSCIRIVHGKGYGSGPEGPVLKRLVNQALRRHERVLAFVSARPVDGGDGAVYVLLGRKGSR